MLEHDNEFAKITLELQKAIDASLQSDLYTDASVAALSDVSEDAASSLNNAAISHGKEADDALNGLYERLDQLSDDLPKNSANAGKVAKINHMLVSMYLQQRATEHVFSSSEQQALQLQVLSIAENIQGTNLQDRQVVQNSPVELKYLQKKEGEYKNATESDAQYIGVNIKNKSFNIKLSGDSHSLAKQADEAIHTIYGLQNMLGSEESAKALAAVAEMHIYVRTMASNHRHEHSKQHPNISPETSADFDYIGLAMKKAHAEWIENGPNAAIAKWNREKEKLGNFNEVETDKKRTWVGRRVKELAAPKKSPSPFDGL